MFKLELGKDEYSRSARLLPALLIYLPVGVAIGAWASIAGTSLVLSGVIAIASTGGLASLLAQFGRDRGQRKEAELYAIWGGKPSTVMLRHSGGAFNRHTLARYHRRLAELLPDLRLPSEAEESADPARCDEVYEACGDYLRAQTRDATRFRVLFQELINYGFRRNLWAMKPAGVAMSLAGMAITAGLLLARTEAGKWPDPALAFSFVLDTFMLVWWMLTIRPDWVKLPAEKYARQLLECADQLEPRTASPRIVRPGESR